MWQTACLTSGQTWGTIDSISIFLSAIFQNVSYWWNWLSLCISSVAKTVSKSEVCPWYEYIVWGTNVFAVFHFPAFYSIASGNTVEKSNYSVECCESPCTINKINLNSNWESECAIQLGKIDVFSHLCTRTMNYQI